ncbi:MAG: hypothetical protein GX430_01065 [Treponema sp.]|nr:hypothetical protein [Treponema sp.]
MGARGWVCVLGNILPKECVELHDLVAVKKDLPAAWTLYRKLLPLLRYLEYAGKSHKTLKYVLDKMGLAGGFSSSPKRALDTEDKAVIDKMLADLGKV